MSDARGDLIVIDEGSLRVIGKGASAALRARRGNFRVIPSPSNVLLLRLEDPQRDPAGTPVVRLAGEIGAPGILCDVVSMIASAGWKGELCAFCEGSTRSIFFEASNIVGAKSDVVGERIGEVLYKLSVLTAQQVQGVLARMPFDRTKRFGETAVDLGLLTREKLFQHVARQTAEIFFAALMVGRGSFFFVDGYDEARLSARVHESAAALLAQGVARMDEIRYFRERIPTSEHVPARLEGRADPPIELLSVWPGMSQVWGAVDGRRPMHEVARACGKDEFEATRIVFQLVQSGFVAINPPMPSSPEGIVAIFNESIRMIFDAAVKHGRGDAMRTHLAAYASSVGILDEVFSGAGPALDGTVQASRIAHNLSTFSGDDPVSSLAQWLHEYIAFALFTIGSDIPKPDHLALTRNVRARLSLLAPKASGSIPPAGRRPVSMRPVAAPSSAPPAPPSSHRAPPLPRKPAGTSSPQLKAQVAPPPASPPSPLRSTQRMNAPAAAAMVTASSTSSSTPSATTPSDPDLESGWSGLPPPTHPSQQLANAPVVPPAAPLPSIATTHVAISSPPPPAPSPLPIDARVVTPPPTEIAALHAAPPFDPFPGATPLTPAHLSAPPPPITPSPLAELRLDDVDETAVQPAIFAPPKRRRRSAWVVVALLFVASGVGALGVTVYLRDRDERSSAISASTTATVPATTAEKPKKKPVAASTVNSAMPSSPPPPPSNAVSISATVAAVVPSTAPTQTPTPTVSATSKPSATSGATGIVRTSAAGAGHRVFVDGRVVGEGPGPFEVSCGHHTVKVGSAGKPQEIEVPCGADVTVGLQ